MYRIGIPALLVASMLLAACQSSSGGGAAGVQETHEEAIQRIERENAAMRAGRGP